MLFTFDKKSKTITTYDETDLKSHNILERQDIEKWVENYPDILGEELLIITTEYDKFDKTSERLDLLAIDKDGNLVIIELKRDSSGKNAELQALKYAAYCSTMLLDDVVQLYQSYLAKRNEAVSLTDAKKEIIDFIEDDEFEELTDKPRIIIVSKEYRPEVTASVLWLRKFGIDITCIKLTPYLFDEKTVAFESTILIPLPEARDFVIQAEKKENVEHARSQYKNEYLEFFGKIKSSLEQILSKQYRTPAARSYYQIGTGIGNVHFEWCFHGRPRSSLGVELHFENKDSQFNTDALNKLSNFKAKIEQATKEKLILDTEWMRGCTRMYIEKNDARMTDELMKWAVDNMKKFIEILLPEIEKLR